jgi:hypothetical protein
LREREIGTRSGPIRVRGAPRTRCLVPRPRNFPSPLAGEGNWDAQRPNPGEG